MSVHYDQLFNTHNAGQHLRKRSNRHPDASPNQPSTANALLT